ncbi:MAG: DMT family transporter [Pelagibacterales bacterium]|nr:DMT family transporter [Pelagibacterales bacterium]
MKNEQLKNFLLLLSLGLCWGPSFLFIKVAIEHIPPITLTFLRITIGAIILYTILEIRHTKLPKFGKCWKHFTIMAFFSSAIPFSLFGFGEKYVDSSLAAVINGSTPLFTIIIAHLATENDRLNTNKIIGSIIGFFGLILLIFPSLTNSNSSFLGVLCVTTASICYSIAFIYSKKYIQGFKPLVVPTAQLIMSAIILLPTSLILENPFEINYVSLPSILCVFALGILGSAIAFIIYYKLLNDTSASYTSMVNYITPIFGAILGYMVLDENLGWNGVIGAIFIIFGVMISNNIIKKKYITKWI